MIPTLGLLIATAISAPATATSTQVSTAGGDWSNIPLVKNSGSHRISPDAVSQMEAAAEGECAQPGRSTKLVKINVPFLIQFSADGAVEHVVVKNINCPAIEKVAGGAVLQLAKEGAYQPTGENVENWYRGELNITSR